MRSLLSRFTPRRTAPALLVLLALAGCAPGPEASAARLRVRNVGTTAIRQLTVSFPDAQIPFGDVPSGATTSYQEAEGGVYAYAAYRLEVGGALVTQPVIDWVGETPLPGRAFTYAIEVNPLGTPLGIVRLVSVTRDE
jgi:hypothetical protein